MAIQISSQRPPSVAGRFASPEGLKKLQAKLKRAESQLTHAKKAANEQRSLMMRAFFTPEGYKKAQAKLDHLDANVKKLEKAVAEIKHTLQVA